ncbi:hypothetical protein [Tenacibaculum jejuense]|uniref:Probable lipoprotein n=1 Tax=Tenacibaculum jejuense TaxID=584609 RepID=A0A238UAQ4_9FLAO|nr:hypothetical protein [Tenacibaculum jejuense]SNR16249.1 Probable lipoprotein precursor [Tenacibaculum jejuense]
MKANIFSLKFFCLIIFTVSVVSCNLNTNSDTKINELQKEIATQEAINNALKEANQNFKKRIEVLNNESEKHSEKCVSEYEKELYLDKETVNFIIDDELNFLLDKKDFAEKAIKLANFENNSFYRIYNNFFNLYLYEPYPIQDKMQFLHYLMNKFDRSSKNIERFFDTETINHIAYLIKQTGFYEKSGLEKRLTCLLATYEHESTDEELFLQLYAKFNSDSWDWSELKTIPSEEMKSTIADIFTTHEIYTQDIFDSYGFWARRSNEGNAATVYKVLKQFQKHISSL